VRDNDAIKNLVIEISLSSEDSIAIITSNNCYDWSLSLVQAECVHRNDRV